MRDESAEVRTYMRIVHAVVARLARRLPRGVQRDDLVSAGASALVIALRQSSHTCPEMLSHYLYVRVRGAVVDELRRQAWGPRRRGVAEQQVVVIGAEDLRGDDARTATAATSAEPSALDRLEDAQRAAAIRGALDRLPERERTIIEMRYFAELPSKQIAAALAVSEARVCQLHERATHRLRGLLEEELELDLDVAA